MVRGPGPILPESELPAHVALLLRGTIAATWDSPDGRTVLAGLYGAEMILGLATLTGSPIAAGVSAVTEVELLMWESGAFRKIVDADLAIALDVLDRSVYAVQALNHLIKVRTFTSAASRLAAVLLRYESFCFATDEPLIPRTKLSDLVGVTARMVSTILRRWEAAGIIRRVGSSGLELLDRSALDAEAAPLDDFPPPDPALPGAWVVPDSPRERSVTREAVMIQSADQGRDSDDPGRGEHDHQAADRGSLPVRDRPDE